MLVQEKSDDSVHSEAGRRFYGMNASRDKDNGFVVAILHQFLITERQPFCGLESFPSLVRRDDEHIDDPLLITASELIPGEKQLAIPFIICLQFHQVSPALLVGVRVNECEFHTADEFVEEEVELQNQFFLRIQR